MKTWAKIAWGVGTAGIATGIGFGIAYLVRLKKAEKIIDVVPTLNIHSVFPLTIRIDLDIKNPSNTALTIRQPYVRLAYMNAALGTSQISNNEVHIPKYGSPSADELKPIFLTIPISGLFSLGGILLDAIQKGTAVKLTVQPYTQLKIATGWKTIPLDPQEIQLKKEAAK